MGDPYFIQEEENFTQRKGVDPLILPLCVDLVPNPALDL